MPAQRGTKPVIHPNKINPERRLSLFELHHGGVERWPYITLTVVLSATPNAPAKYLVKGCISWNESVRFEYTSITAARDVAEDASRKAIKAHNKPYPNEE